ncbi:hypothetical protein C4580_03895 [Candidatus Woesearchaeota archaeon]|nr:MAG: hypothetical protein C4580_03895 [Candidatus Woesearchaeota archaeon]
MRPALWLFIALSLAVIAQARFEYFYYPDIRDDFCGVHINFQFCKCAFHNEYCEAVQLDKSAAYAKVNSAFETHVKKSIETFAHTCMNAGGIYSVIKRQCEYCENGKVPKEGVCVNPNDARSVQEQFNLPHVESQGGSSSLGYVRDAEGEFFVYSPGRAKWIGPVRQGLTLFEGDVLYTTPNGRATIHLGNSNLFIAERTMLRLPTPQKKRSVLEQGIINVWEAVKRLVKNEPFEVEGAHSITGRKGTDFIMEVTSEADVYTVHDGAIEVWKKDDSSRKIEIGAGKSARATSSAIEYSAYEWDSLLAQNRWTNRDLSEPSERNLTPFIDPDLVHPSETAYTGDLAGKIRQQKSRTWIWAVLAAILIAAAYFFLIRKKK